MMAEKVVMPKLGASMEEGTIDNWLVEVGDKVEAGDPIVEIQTDKITIEVEAEVDGVLLKKLYDVGDTVPVLEVIAYIGEEGEAIDHLVETPTQTENQVEPEQQETVETNQTASHLRDGRKIRRTPLARRLAEEYGFDLKDIVGTGPKGRIQKVDVERYITNMKKKITPLAKKIAEDKQVDYSRITGSGARGKIVKADVLKASEQVVRDAFQDERVPLSGIRKVIAERMSQSFYTAPHVTLFSEVDMTEVIKLRKQLLPEIEKETGLRISFNEIMLKATAVVLRKHPNINVSLVDDKEIVYHRNIHLGFAVAMDDGLVVPVIEHADQKGLATITKEAKTLAEQARNKSLSPEKMQGSTFTISNLGMYAVNGFTPIINPPNAAILGVGQIQEKVVVINGEMKVRSMMELSLSFDHRVIDGAPAARFLTDLKDILEHPYKLLM